MNGENEALLQQGIGEVRTGNKREGARLLAQVVKSEPQSEDAWFWLAAATDQPSEAAACLRRVLAINPGNTRATQALELLGQSNGNLSRVNNSGDLFGNSAPANQSRSLNTGELLGFGGGNAATIAQPQTFSATTAAPFSENELFGITSATTNTPPSRPSDLFGGTGTLNDTNVSTPPFGQPSWAASNEASPTRPPLPNFNSDPYTGQPSTGFAGGMRFGQLDPKLAAEQAAQAAQNSANSYVDTGAEIRAGLLDENSPARAQIEPLKAGKQPKIKSPKPVKIKLTSAPVTRRRKNKLPLLVAALVIILLFVGVVLWKFVLSSTNAATTTVADNVALTTSPTDTSNVTATVGNTSTGGVSVIAGTSKADTTTAATTASVTTAVVTTAPVTTAPATTTALTTVAASPVAPTVVTGTDNQAQATPTLSIVVPPLQGGKPPADVMQYVSDSKSLMDRLKSYEDLLTSKVEVPYRRGDITAQAELNKLFRTDISTMEMGQFAYRLKNQYVPLGAYYLSQISSEYADDISAASKAWDGFFDSGKLSYLDDVSRYTEKAIKDRIRWVSALSKGYPYK